MTKFVYKIRRRSDGLYSTGGGWPSFKAKGKQWPSVAALHAHFNIVYGRGGQRQNYVDCEIVTIEVTDRETAATDGNEYFFNREKMLREKEAEKERKRQARIPKCPHCKQALHGKGCANV